MKNIKYIIIITILISPFFGYSQNKFDYTEMPKNTIAATPNIRLLGENGYLIYYKRAIQQQSSKMKLIRIGMDFYSTIKNNDEASSYYKLFLGLEHYKKMERFSLSYGVEGSLSLNSATNRHIEPIFNSIFSQNGTSAGNDLTIKKGTYTLFSAIGFIGIKYHFNKHFALGYESAVGFGFYKSTDKLEAGGEESVNGFINDIDPSRHFTIEYSF